MSSTYYLILADLVLFMHVLVVIFVVFGLLLTLIGWGKGWQWVRDWRFRTVHLLCVMVVAIQAWAGIICPLTSLEMWLRKQGQGDLYERSFISHWMKTLLYYDLPAWVFIAAYTVFGLLVIVIWILLRPKRRAK